MVTAWRNGKVRNAQIFAAASAKGACLWGELRTAEIADGDTGETQEGTATKGTGAGEQCTREAVRGTSQHTYNSSPNRSLRQRDVESQGDTLTRKDAPHSRPTRLRAGLPPMARVYGQVEGERYPNVYAAFRAGWRGATRLPAMVEATPATTSAAPAYCNGAGRSCASHDPSNKATRGLT
jgi:hypothetical protein